MKIIQKLDEFAGKKIVRAVWGKWRECVVFLFEDGTSAQLEASSYSGDEVNIRLSDDIDIEDQGEIGIISKGEYDLIKAKKLAESEKNNEVAERKTYEKLKAKFEGKGNHESKA